MSATPAQLTHDAQWSADARLVGDMVVQVGRTFYPDGYVRTLYTCRHLLTSGDCGIYETRPVMCRDFPYGRACPHGEACAWDGAREGLIDRAGRRHLPVAGQQPLEPRLVGHGVAWLRACAPVHLYVAPDDAGVTPAEVVDAIKAERYWGPPAVTTAEVHQPPLLVGGTLADALAVLQRPKQ